MSEKDNQAKPLLTLGIRPPKDHSAKPAELIQVTGHQALTLNARRTITVLWHNAHMQGIEEGKDYRIEISRLKTSSHKGDEMVEEAIEALMGTILKVRLPNGKTRRVQFLGGNDLDDPDRPLGELTYSFDKRLVEILRSSVIWGKIALPVLMAFTSKYAVSLYENVAQWTGLSRKVHQDLTLEEFRDMLGVEEGKYTAFGGLNKHVIKPAVAEINALAPFNVSVLPIKLGRRVARIRLGWTHKSSLEMDETWREMERPKAGRRERVSGAVEFVYPPHPDKCLINIDD